MCKLSSILLTVLGDNYNYGIFKFPTMGIFYIHGSVRRDSILVRSNEMQQYAGVYLLQNYSTCFGCLSHPPSGVHKTVTAASGTGHITFQKNNLPPAWHAGGRLLF